MFNTPFFKKPFQDLPFELATNKPFWNGISLSVGMYPMFVSPQLHSCLFNQMHEITIPDVRICADSNVVSLHTFIYCKCGLFSIDMCTLPETNSSHLNTWHLKRKQSSSNHRFSGAKLLLVSGRIFSFSHFASPKYVMLFQNNVYFHLYLER